MITFSVLFISIFLCYRSFETLGFPDFGELSTISVVGWWRRGLLGVAVAPSVLLLGIVLHVLRVVHVGVGILLLLLLVVLELVLRDTFTAHSRRGHSVVGSLHGPRVRHGRAGSYAVRVLLSPRALGRLPRDLSSVHGHDGAASGLLVVVPHEGVALVAEEPDLEDPSLSGEGPSKGVLVTVGDAAAVDGAVGRRRLPEHLVVLKRLDCTAAAGLRLHRRGPVGWSLAFGCTVRRLRFSRRPVGADGSAAKPLAIHLERENNNDQFYHPR